MRGQRRTNALLIGIMRFALALPIVLIVLAAILAFVVPGGGPDVASSTARTDGNGDPFVTDAQVAAIKVGMNENTVFQRLGGQGDSGLVWIGSAPTDMIGIHNYPIRGTGDPSPDNALLEEAGVMQDKTLYWRLCVQVVTGKVVAKRRIGPIWDTPDGSCWGAPQRTP